MSEPTRTTPEESTLDMPVRPDLDKLPENVQDYISWLETDRQRIEDEMASQPGAEARGIAWTELFGVAKDPEGQFHPVKINVTQRSDCDSTHALQALVNTLTFAKGWRLLPYPHGVDSQFTRPPRQVEQEQPAPAPTPAGASGSTPAPVSAPSPAAPGGNGNAVNSFLCVRLKVTPVEGGKVTLEFFGNDKAQPVNKFPTLKNTMSMERAIEALIQTGNWRPENFTSVMSYEVKYQVEWKQGKQIPNSTNFYKDLVAIRPA